MRILLLGGTGFVGRHVAHAAITAGYDVTFANRGETDPSAFPEYEFVRIDRGGDVSALAAVDADIVVDTSGYTPDAVLASTRAVSQRVRTYVFMSSIDAYDLSASHIDEGSKTKSLAEHDSTSQRTPELYGAHKVRCERLLEETLGAERVLSVRAGFIVGPNDNTDRFTYWPVRIAAGGEVLVPDSREMPVQLIDARDVAGWVVRSLASGAFGTFNLVGNAGALTFGDVIDACVRETTSHPTFTWASPAFLEAQAVGPWIEMPLWLPPSDDFAGLRNIANARALASGLTLRPLQESVRDILSEFQTRESKILRAGLSQERERALLTALTADDRFRR